MNHKRILHLNSKQDGSENRDLQVRKNVARDRKGLPHRAGLPIGRGEVAWLNSRRKVAESERQYTPLPCDPLPWLRYLIQRFAPAGLQRKAGVEAAGGTNHSGIQAKLICRFLSWCFPVRGFNSPLQRLLYLSIQGPKAKRRSRLFFR
jgi:hypothetical protein